MLKKYHQRKEQRIENDDKSGNISESEVSKDGHRIELECGPMPNLMAALPNIGGALCSTPQSLADAPTTRCRAVTLPRRKTR